MKRTGYSATLEKIVVCLCISCASLTRTSNFETDMPQFAGRRPDITWSTELLLWSQSQLEVACNHKQSLLSFTKQDRNQRSMRRHLMSAFIVRGATLYMLKKWLSEGYGVLGIRGENRGARDHSPRLRLLAVSPASVTTKIRADNNTRWCIHFFAWDQLPGHGPKKKPWILKTVKVTPGIRVLVRYLRMKPLVQKFGAFHSQKTSRFWIWNQFICS